MAGDGSIYKRHRARPDGTPYVRWIAQASVGPRGQRRLVRRVCRTRGEASAALREMLGPQQSQQSLGDYLRSWLDETARPSVAPKTLLGYRAVTASLAPLHDIPLRALRPEDIETVLNRLPAQRKGQEKAVPASPKTRRNALAMLRRALSVAVKRGHLLANPALLVEMPRVPRVSREAMTPAKARGVLEAVKADRYAAAYTLALCGLRLSEVLGLAWSDVDLDTGTVQVRYQIVGSGKRAHRAQLKTRASEAPVTLPSFVVERLRAHRAAQLAERVAAGQPTEEGLVFVTERGYAVNGSWLSKHFGDLLTAAKMESLSFHALRHATASLLAQGGIAPRVAQEYLRHSQVMTTLSVYTHTARGQDREAAEALERMLG